MPSPKGSQTAGSLRRAPSTGTSTAGDHTPSSSPRAPAGPGRRRRLREYYQATPDADPLDLDSPAFDAKACFDQFSTTLSISALLKQQTDLAEAIRELDAERQALVYNHHHELIDASDTIRKMSARASSLDSTLDGLASSLETISQLAGVVAVLPPSSDVASDGFDPLAHLPPLLTLPAVLSSLLDDTIDGETHPKTPGLRKIDSANLLWGTYGEALRSAYSNQSGSSIFEIDV